MAIWYYYDNNGQKHGPCSGGQLRWFVKQGTITPETLIENEDGKSVPAKEVKGLTFAETPPVEANPFTAAAPMEANPFTATVPQRVLVPVATKKKSSLWIPIAGVLVLLAVGGIAWAVMSPGKPQKNPPAPRPIVNPDPPIILPIPIVDPNPPIILPNPIVDPNPPGGIAPQPGLPPKGLNGLGRDEEKRKAEEARRRAEEGQRAERAARLAGAVDLKKEISRSGFDGDYRLRDFVQYGNARLRDRLYEEDKNYRHIDILEVARKEEALQRLNRVKAEIKAEQERIATMVFFHDYAYTSSNVAAYGSTSSFTMNTNGSIGRSWVYIRFSSLKAEEILLPKADITCNTVEMWSENIHLSIRGNTDNIRALARNENDYRVRVWFENLRTENNRYNDIYAAILKVEIIDARRNGGRNNGNPPAKDVNGPPPGEVDLITFVKESNFLAVCLPRYRDAGNLTIGKAFDSVPQFSLQKWEPPTIVGGKATVVLTFVATNRNGTRNRIRVPFTLDAVPNVATHIGCSIARDGKLLTPSEKMKFFDTMYAELR